MNRHICDCDMTCQEREVSVSQRREKLDHCLGTGAWTELALAFEKLDHCLGTLELALA